MPSTASRRVVLKGESDLERFVLDRVEKALDALGNILRELGQPKGALKAYEKLLEVHPYWPGAKQAVEELTREVGGQRT